jgi:hypothetical protein
VPEVVFDDELGTDGCGRSNVEDRSPRCGVFEQFRRCAATVAWVVPTETQQDGCAVLSAAGFNWIDRSVQDDTIAETGVGHFARAGRID